MNKNSIYLLQKCLLAKVDGYVPRTDGYMQNTRENVLVPGVSVKYLNTLLRQWKHMSSCFREHGREVSYKI